VAGELAGRGVVVQVNTEENPRLAERFRVSSIPAVLFFRRGQVVDRVNGAMDRNSLLAWWRKHAA
jgi:thioredoxin-like negative regulator of GroEL